MNRAKRFRTAAVRIGGKKSGTRCDGRFSMMELRRPRAGFGVPIFVHISSGTRRQVVETRSRKSGNNSREKADDCSGNLCGNRLGAVLG